MKNKNAEIKIRLSSEDKVLIKNKAKEVNMTVSEYILTLVRKKQLIIISELPTLLGDIHGAAININQAAKVANTQKFVNQQNVETLLHESATLKSKVDEILSRICEREPYDDFTYMDKMYELLLHMNTKLNNLTSNNIDGS